MARDYAKQRQASTRRPKKSNTRRTAAKATAPARGWQLYLAGLFSGVFLSFLLYLGTLPPGPGTATQVAQDESRPAETEPPKPRFDFYTLLPEQTMDLGVEAAETRVTRASKPTEFYLLQAGAFKQREDAESRRAQLLLLNLEPKIEETNSDNGRWYRVYLGPFQSRAKLNKARSLTAAQNIDTLLLKRSST
ncbi:MAG: SPOR domain-containing protein [Proteobacteria bacterium]|nr:SPOR domain-containing protein [Pseudomonadota bacterium]